MADVDKSVGVIYQRRSTRTASESDNLSPNVKDAMDRIFPKSPSKFLQSPFPDSHDNMFLVGNRIPPSSQAETSQPLACTVSTAHIPTDTTTTATAIFTGLTTSASGTKSPIMSSSVPAYANQMASLPAPAIVKNNSLSQQNGIASSSSKPKTSSKAKTNRVDIQICAPVIGESPKSTVSERVCSESDLSSQPETMLVKEKKIIKRKRKKQCVKETSDNNDSDVGALASPSNGYDCSSHSQENSVVNGEMYSADDAVMYPPSFNVQQKLPRARRVFIHVSKDTKYIQKKFLPCYVVLKKAASGNVCGVDLGLSLTERVNYLSELCLKNHIDCPKFKSIQYRNIFEECLIQNSEDEFISPRGRSLRKRNQNVSYVEPSEDDLLDDMSSFGRKKKAQNKAAAAAMEAQKKGDELNEKPAVAEEVKKSDDVEHKDKSDKSIVGKKNKEEAHQSDNSSEIDRSKTGTAPTGMKDDKGRDLVYVYPKGSVHKSSNKKRSTSDKSVDNNGGKSVASPKKRMGPASKTNQPLNLSASAASSLTTLSLPRSLLGGNLTVRGMPSMAASHAIPTVVQPSPSTATSSTSSSPQFYMVKIDGKDFLVPIMTGATPPRPGMPGLPAASALSSLLARAPAPSMAGGQPFPVNRLSMIPGMPMTTGVRMFSPGLSTANLLSHVPLVGSPQLSTACIPVSGLSQMGLGAANRPPQLIPSSTGVSVSNPSVTVPPKSATLTSLVRAPLATPMSLMPTISQAASLASRITTPTIVAPLAAPTSTTVLRSTRPRYVTTAVSPSVTTNAAAATSTRCFRIIVPGCSATGVPARIATLGSQANSSPLTHMALSSSLLPQRKRSVDEMTPEKRAAKRRRLEKKYPLPPGVVIKTEPDEVPTPTVTTAQSGSVRSLLGQNIQLITSASSRSGSAPMQNIRLVTPVSGSRQMRLGANFIIRTPNNSTVNLSSGSLSALAASASSLIVSPPSTQSGAVSMSASSILNRLSASTATLSSTTSSTTSTTRAVTKSITTTAVGQGSTLSTSTNSSNAADKITTLSYSVASLSNNSITSSSSSLSSSSSKEVTTVDSLKGSIKDLRKLISAQENVGLKGPRLDKLKEILVQKEKALTELEKEADDQSSGVTASDPVVID